MRKGKDGIEEEEEEQMGRKIDQKRRRKGRDEIRRGE